MAQVVFSAEALGDLERLSEFLLDTAPEAAADTIAHVLDATGILSAHPLVGRRVEDVIRELVISRGNSGYLALYIFDAGSDLVRILRIRHQRDAGYRD